MEQTFNFCLCNNIKDKFKISCAFKHFVFINTVYITKFSFFLFFRDMKKLTRSIKEIKNNGIPIHHMAEAHLK